MKSHTNTDQMSKSRRQACCCWYGQAADGTAQSITFSEYAEKWMGVYKENQLKPSSIETCKKHLRAHVLPAFGKHEIAGITTEDMQLFLNEMGFIIVLYHCKSNNLKC